MLPFNSGLFSQCCIAVNISSVAWHVFCCAIVPKVESANAVTPLKSSNCADLSIQLWPSFWEARAAQHIAEKRPRMKAKTGSHPSDPPTLNPSSLFTQKNISSCVNPQKTCQSPWLTEDGGSTALAVIDPKRTPRVVNWDHPSFVD